MPPLPALRRRQEVRRGAERAAVQPPPVPEHGRVRPPPDQRRPRPGRRGGGAHCARASGAQPAGVPAPLLRGGADDRLLPQRYADALVELASAGRPANIQVTATIETLKGMAGAAGAEMEFSLPISSVAVQRMACDCSVTRVLLSQESVTIDVGRSKRVISGPARKALMARDGHCRWPGCERPASWCDGHHVVHWIDGGGTDLDNLVLLCRMVHEGGWQL